ncbi:MAG: CocE/NonD family hydrolase [Haloarculaceae archaeon]
MVTYEVERHPDLLVPVDGETVAATRYEPTPHDGPLPVVLVVTPYRKDDRIAFGSWDPSVRYFCEHGYEVVVADLLGTGASSGTKRPYHREEGEEIAAVVEWLADREWCTGDVGMFGLSYGAWTQYATAAVDPEPLKAIVPVAVAPDAYESSCRGGVYNPMKRATWAAMVQNLRALPPSRRDPDGRWADVWADHLDAIDEEEPWVFQFLAHEAHDDFWAERAVAAEEIGVPTLAACGYRDDHTAPMVEFFDGIDAPKRLVLGPWRHTMPERGREAATDFRRQAVAWFDRFLKGEDTDATDGPTVTYWTEREGGWTPGAGTWRGADRWPTADGDGTLSYAFTPDGLRPADAYESGAFDRTWELDTTVGVESLDRVGSVENVGVPTNADDARSLTVETDPLDAAVEWTGTGTATVRVRPTAADSLVAVRVSDVAPDGTARLVTGGHLRASHRDGHDATEPLEPGTVTPVEVPLKPKSHVFETGHRIRVAVSGSYFPRALPLREQGAFDVVSTPATPTELRVPGRVHEGGVAFDDELDVSGPDTSVPTAPWRKTGLTSRWSVERDHTADAATLRTETGGLVDLPHGDYRAESAVEACAATDDPTSAWLRTENAVELDYDTETVRAETTARVARDAARLTTTVTVDGDPVYERTWRRSNLG